jgi:hypothetical protein
MRVGQNPAKAITHVPKPQRVTVAVVSYIPFLGGYYAQGLDVLRACLESLWSSTSEPYDLLVYDNASCPEVRNYLSSALDQGKIQTLILSSQNVGKGGAWNMIFQGAPGEVIAYTDSDVRFYPGWLTQTLNILDTYPNAGMVTARPMRTPEAFYTSTLEWARQTPEVQIEKLRHIPWEVYREHVLSLGTSEEQARQWYDSRLDWRVTYQGVQAIIGAAHFQFAVLKDRIQPFLPFHMDRPMGQVRSLDEQLNEAGLLRLTTCDPLVKHMGNRLDEGASHAQAAVTASGPGGFWRLPFIRRALLSFYDRIFRLYYDTPTQRTDQDV